MDLDQSRMESPGGEWSFVPNLTDLFCPTFKAAIETTPSCAGLGCPGCREPQSSALMPVARFRSREFAFFASRRHGRQRSRSCRQSDDARSGGLTAGAEAGHRYGQIGAGGGEVHALAD
jgi:hypothetical protein